MFWIVFEVYVCIYAFNNVRVFGVFKQNNKNNTDTTPPRSQGGQLGGSKENIKQIGLPLTSLLISTHFTNKNMNVNFFQFYRPGIEINT